MSEETPLPLAACPFCGGPPSEILRDAVTLKPHFVDIPAEASELDFYLQAFVFCHECGAQAEEIEEDVIDEAGLEELKQKARDAWNTRNNRNHDLYLANLPIAPAGAGKISPVPVERDSNGFWTHPDFFEPANGNEYAAPGEYEAWEASQGVVTALCYMPDDQGMVFESDADCSGWTPAPPDGAGWFIASIHDTEDGIVCVWLRNVEGSHV